MEPAKVVKFPKKQVKRKKKLVTIDDFKELTLIILGVTIGDLLYDLIRHIF